MRDHPSSSERAWQGVFIPVWASQALSLLGSQLVTFALIWHVTETRGSATALAGATLVGLLPTVLLGPLAGVLVDRWNRRVIMMVMDGITALATLGLAVLFALQVVQIWHIYVLLLIRAAGSGLHQLAMLASTSLMVPKEHLTRVQGMNQTLSGALNIVSAPLGAALLAILPMQGVLAIDVGSAAVAIGTLLFVRIPQPERRPAQVSQARGVSALVEDARVALRYVASWPGLGLLVIGAALIHAVNTPAFSLLPLLVNKHFGGGPLHFGGTRAALGLGVLLGGLILSVWGGFRRRTMTSMLGLAGLGVGMLGVALAPASAFPLALAAMLVLGMALPIATGPLMAIVQAHVEPDMQGRVLTLIVSMAAAVAPIGLLLAGPLADLLGVRAWFVLSGTACLLLSIAGCLLRPIAHLEERYENGRAQHLALSGATVADPAAEASVGVAD